MRGNHEDYQTARTFMKKYRQAEPKSKAPSFIDELRQKFSLTQQQEIAIYRVYDLLPVVLYLGCSGARHVNFVQCCHGGIELGYDPNMLIHAPCKVTFEHITSFKRKTNFCTKLATEQQDIFKRNLSSAWLANELRDGPLTAPVSRIPGTDQITYLGFLWSDFFIDTGAATARKELGMRTQTGMGLVFGTQLTQTIMQWGDSYSRKIRGIIRGHQHNNQTGGPMLDRLCCHKGLLDVWRNKQLFTLISAPDAKLEDTGEGCFTYDSFAMLTLAHTYDSWRFVHYWQDRSLERKYWSQKMSN